MDNKNIESINKKRKITLAISILLLLILIIGSTYAWFKLKVTSATSNIINAGGIQIELKEFDDNTILLQNQVPISDTRGLQTKEYIFELKNNGKDKRYTIYLDDLALNTDEVRMDDKNVKYNIMKNNQSLKTELLSLTGTNPNRIIETGIISKETINYKLRLWIDKNASNDVMGTVFYAKLRVEAVDVAA